MNLDDESLLSAYLDDELDPADRLAVEWSVESSPPLADQLRALASARDVVAGLGRPVIPMDLSSSITARLAADRRRARLHALARPGRVALTVTGLSGMAASLLFALFLLQRSLHETQPNPPSIVHQNPGAAAPRSHTDPTSDLDSTAKPLTIASNRPGPTVSPESPFPVKPSGEARQGVARLEINKMLEEPDVRVILITTDVIGAADSVQKLILDDARGKADFGRISIQTGIVVDPTHPGSAEVFVVPIDESGRESFVSKLRSRFDELLEVEGPARPELVTQLTEVGQVAIFEGIRASPLVDPPGGLASVVAFRPAAPRPNVFPSETPLPREAPDTEAPNSPKPKPDSRKPTDPVTLLVWVHRPIPR